MAVEDIPLDQIVNSRSSDEQYLWKFRGLDRYRWDDRIEYMYALFAIPVEGQGLPELPPAPEPSAFTAEETLFLQNNYMGISEGVLVSAASTNQVYAKDQDGKVAPLGYSKLANGSTIVQRDSAGGIIASDPSNSAQVATKNYVDRNNVPASAASNAQVYIRDGSGVTRGLPYSIAAAATTVAIRDADGTLAVSTPTAAGHAVTKAYVDNLFASLGGTVVE